MKVNGASSGSVFVTLSRAVRRRSRWLAAPPLLLYGAACATPPQTSPAAPAARTVVVVDNQSYNDMHVFGARGSRRVRLGYVRSRTTAELTIPASLVSGARMVVFVAEPVGLNRNSVSDEIFVNEGDQVRLLIPPR